MAAVVDQRRDGVAVRIVKAGDHHAVVDRAAVRPTVGTDALDPSDPDGHACLASLPPRTVHGPRDARTDGPLRLGRLGERGTGMGMGANELKPLTRDARRVEDLVRDDGAEARVDMQQVGGDERHAGAIGTFRDEHSRLERIDGCQRHRWHARHSHPWRDRWAA